MYFFDLIAQLETGFLIQDFAVVMIVAAVMVFVTHKLKQPMVIGYLLAGMVIGPFTPPFSLIHEVGTINTLAEIGIIILLFVIGTEFPITKLRSVGRISMVVGIAESLGTLLVTFFVARTLGFSQFDSMFLALAMSVTSTVVTVKILEELKNKSTLDNNEAPPILEKINPFKEVNIKTFDKKLHDKATSLIHWN